MTQEQVVIRTKAGACTTHVFIPNHDGPWPGVIVYMDGVGIRPGIVAIAQRLSEDGYVVLLPDLFYRFGPYEPFDPKVVFAGDFRALLGPMIRTTGNAQAVEDSEVFIDYLRARQDVAQGLIGVVGFCMGGGMALSVAGAFPHQIGAAASFHGGNLATDAPISPHLLAPDIRAEVYVAGADKDQTYPPEMAERLVRAFDDAGVNHRTESYTGAQHGWMCPDFPVYDAQAAERGWSELLALFDRAIRKAKS